MISNNVDWIPCSFQIVAPVLESIKNGKKLLIMDVVVEFWRSKCAGVESDQMDFSVVSPNANDGG